MTAARAKNNLVAMNRRAGIYLIIGFEHPSQSPILIQRIEATIVTAKIDVSLRVECRTRLGTF